MYPREVVRAALRSLGRDSRRRRDLPAEVMVYYVTTMALFRTVSAREVLCCLVDGLRWVSPDLPVRIVAYRIEGGDETVMLATTLLDHRTAPAADRAGEDPDRISFVRVMRRRIINPDAFPPRGPAGRRD